MFREDLVNFLRNHSYKEKVVNNIALHYILAGKENAPTIVCFGDLYMQTVWIKYIEELEKDYKILMLDSPIGISSVKEHADILRSLLTELGIGKIIIMAVSDGGLSAQVYADLYPGDVTGMVLIASATLNSKFLDRIRGKRIFLPIAKARIKRADDGYIARRISAYDNDYFLDESEDEKSYCMDFVDTIASDPKFKDKFIRTMDLLFSILKYPKFKKESFVGLDRKVLLLFPQKDIIEKEDQERLVDVMINPYVGYIQGGHLSYIVRYKDYLEYIKAFLPKCLG